MNAKMEQYKTLVAGIAGGMLGWLSPMAGDVFTLVWIFVLNFMVGFLAGKLAKGEDFDFKKAWRCIWESCIFFGIVCSIFVIGKIKQSETGALQCVSTVVYAVIYFYSCNILRNLKLLLKTGTPAYRCVTFLYHLATFEFVRLIPSLRNFVESEDPGDAKEGTEKE